MNIRHNFFNKTFLPSTITDWNKLDPAIRNLTSFSQIEESILKFIRSAPNSIFQCHNLKGIKHLTQLWVNFSHLLNNKVKYSFQDTVKPFCTYSLLLLSTTLITKTTS